MYDFDIQEPELSYPTPDVGETVQWFRQADCDHVAAAIVTKVLGPGRVALTVFPPAGAPFSVDGCLYMGDPEHEEQGRATIEQGGWDYRQHALPSKKVRLIAFNELKRRREESRKQAEKAAERINEDFLEKQRAEDGTDEKAPIAPDVK